MNFQSFFFYNFKTHGELSDCLTTQNEVVSDSTVNIYGNIQFFEGKWENKFEIPVLEEFLSKDGSYHGVYMLHLKKPNWISTTKFAGTNNDLIEVKFLSYFEMLLRH